MAEPLECPLEELRELYVVRGLSMYAIGTKHLHVAPNTIEKWCSRNGLHKEREEYKQSKPSRSSNKHDAVVDGEFISHPENDIATVPEATAEGALQTSPLTHHSPLATAHGSTFENQPDDEDATAFGRLSRYKQKFVLVYVDNQRTHTQKQIAEMLNIDENAVCNNLKDPDVREAILDLARAEFKFKGELSLLNRIQQLEDEQKDRPDDRKLKADILGLINGNTVNINFNSFGGSVDKSIKRRN